MTDSEKARVIALWESRASLEQIYRILPYRRYQALKMVAELRADGILKPRTMTKDAISAVGEAWKSGMKDPRDLAEMFGYSVNTVRRYLDKSGVREGKRPPTNYKHSPKTNDIARQLQLGSSPTEIAKNFGVSRQYVHQIKKRLEKEV